jgi:DNA-binding GntR family transcriptional regulator
VNLPVEPLNGEGCGSIALRVQSYLRSLVLSGTLEPGSEFSQVELAKALGVSRTPLREALRGLQKEGLVEAEPNQKARVSGFNAAELDAVYAARVCMEAVAVCMTARLRSSELLAELDDLVAGMEAVTGADGIEEFQPLHRRYHRLLVSCAPPMFLTTVHVQQDRAERYWRLLNLTEAAPHARRDREHREIVAAIRAQDQNAAGAALARHLARSALTLITHMAPEHDVPATRAALRLYAEQPAVS